MGDTDYSDGGASGIVGWALRRAVVWGAVAVVAVAVIDGLSSDPATDDHGAQVRRPAVPVVAASPTQEDADGGRTMVIPMDRGGHFRTEGRVNGEAVRFMVDTGATGVALDRQTAKQVGLHLRDHDFTVRSRTANGIARAAPVTLREVRIGRISVRDVEGYVMEGSMNGQALLGMSFLSRLDGYQVRGDKLILTW